MFWDDRNMSVVKQLLNTLCECQLLTQTTVIKPRWRFQWTTGALTTQAPLSQQRLDARDHPWNERWHRFHALFARVRAACEHFDDELEKHPEFFNGNETAIIQINIGSDMRKAVTECQRRSEFMDAAGAHLTHPRYISNGNDLRNYPELKTLSSKCWTTGPIVALGHLIVDAVSSPSLGPQQASAARFVEFDARLEMLNGEAVRWPAAWTLLLCLLFTIIRQKPESTT